MALMNGKRHVWLLKALIAAALALVFAAYLSPSVTMDLANRVWSCF